MSSKSPKQKKLNEDEKKKSVEKLNVSKGIYNKSFFFYLFI